MHSEFQSVLSGQSVVRPASWNLLLGPWHLKPLASARSPAAEEAGGEEEQRLDEGEGGVDADAEEPERQGDQPDQRGQEQRQQRQRPADGQQHAPEEKNSDDLHGGDAIITPFGALRLRKSSSVLPKWVTERQGVTSIG